MAYSHRVAVPEIVQVHNVVDKFETSYLFKQVTKYMNMAIHRYCTVS
jgi:hypothetical protein